MRLSQGHLSLLETCPRQFQHQILEQLSLSNLDLDLEDRLRSGSEFHQLVQQRSLQLPIEVLLAEDPQLTRWFHAFETAEPDLFAAMENLTGNLTKKPDFAESEHVRTWACLGHSLVVVYDYVVLQPELALILDWKTYGKPIHAQPLIDSWQSRLYPYVLSQTSHYDPAQIEMRYWFFHPDGTAQSLRLPHSSARQLETDRQLTHLLTQLNDWLTAYGDHGEAFPQTDRWETCNRCPFSVRCGRSMDAIGLRQTGLDPAIAWDDIPEIADQN
jgi:PD-(D/E)XK nuclease superfamily